MSPKRSSLTTTSRHLVSILPLSFPSPEMTEYKYMMKGLDKSWTALKTNRKVYFTQLSPGHYTFTVKAANNNGIWTNKETTIEIDIAPPFWKSIWAYIIYTLLFSWLLYYLLRRYHRNVRQNNERLIQLLENDKEKELYNAKIEFFTNVAHEIRTPLTLIKGAYGKGDEKSRRFRRYRVTLK
jgi:signal transduction histidine kinase